MSNRMQIDIGYMQDVFGILTADDIAIPGFTQWLCEKGTHQLGMALTLVLIFISFMVWARTYRTVQPEISSRNATMGSVLSGFAAVCEPPCANNDAFGTAQRPKYLFAATKRCNYYTPSEPSHGLTFDSKVDYIICSVSPSCYCVWWLY